ncbi:cytochrome b5 domain-containing protein [Xanthovirga aplysinae]|uniref:cytochrome b5 domain-containing protein n=1 Tax=Xanthovirga aplysinae TaxID=2529853 RepID=UPI0012BD7EFD|nr:cytochrome b5 domain-containing protein [Xanthovirga aplysinae]MTI31167.1 hypothetical protein [Xanthovirga aplysinae]
MIAKNKVKYSPAYEYLLNAEAKNIELEHENLGFLSLENGFMPSLEPLQSLPSQFSKWDEIAKNLPFHYKHQTLRKALKKLPLLIPDKENLPDKYLCRASALMSMLAHAYVRNERVEDLNIPESIEVPWKIITKRLKRPKPFLSYIDLIMYNWKIRNRNEDFEVENLDLLIPTVNNQEEQVFYLTQAEISHKTRGAVKIIAGIQNHILNDRLKEVVKGIKALKTIIENITETSFLKINPNPRSRTYVDPIVWAKTVAPFAVPLKEGIQGPSGTSAPIFHLLDTFIERAKYDTILGKEALFIRKWYPEHWRNLLNKVDKISVLEYIGKKQDGELTGIFNSFLESYSGETGFLGVHRKKVYGYLQMAFKVGRSVTIGGFTGLFKARTWEEVDDQLEITRKERYVNKKLRCPYSTIMDKVDIGNGKTKHIKLNVAKKGIDYRPGDRIAILPKNKREVVNNLLRRMSLTGEEPVELTNEWKNYLSFYYHLDRTSINVTEILSYANLSNVKQIIGCPHMSGNSTSKITFEEFVQNSLQNDLDVKKFLLPHLCEILEPEKERLYSISSGFDKEEIDLIVEHSETKVKDKVFKGVTSSYLHSEESNQTNFLPFKIVRPLRFSPPKEINVPIYLFAGGTGISPFKGFWDHLRSQNKIPLLHLFYSVKQESDIVHPKELIELMKLGAKVSIAITRESKKLDIDESLKKGELAFVNDSSLSLIQLMKQSSKSIFKALKSKSNSGLGGLFYVCGKAGFSKHIISNIKEIIEEHIPDSPIEHEEIFYSLFSENRFMQDIFTSPHHVETTPPRYFNMSEIVKHNNDKNGYWVAINNKVYDLSEFKEIHPGGAKIVLDNTGRDATHEFKRANHHKSPEIMSMLSMYYIGELKQINLPKELQGAYNEWLNTLHFCTEMLNTFVTDHSINDKKTTAVEDSANVTPYKLALLVENHLRFKEEYIPLIIKSLKALFADDKKLLNLIRLIKSIHIEDFSQEKISRSIRQGSIGKAWSKIINIQKGDEMIIKEFRNLLWAGLKFFEFYEPDLDRIFEHSMSNLIINYSNALEEYKRYYESINLEVAI